MGVVGLERRKTKLVPPFHRFFVLFPSASFVMPIITLVCFGEDGCPQKKRKKETNFDVFL